LPWLFALFLAGLGSAGVDNWGHAGGLLVGTVAGLVVTPRQWSGEGAARRLAAATGALLGTISLGMFAAPSLPVLGALRDGPFGVQVQMPFGWRKASTAPERISYSNGLVGAFRGSATVVSPACRSKPCGCDRLSEAVAELVRADLWRLADVGALGGVHLGEMTSSQISGAKAASIEGIVLGADGQARVGATCVERDRTSIAVVVLEAPSTSRLHLETRIARTVRWPVFPQEP